MNRRRQAGKRFPSRRRIDIAPIVAPGRVSKRTSMHDRRRFGY
jgi:hypothetical protein